MALFFVFFWIKDGLDSNGTSWSWRNLCITVVGVVRVPSRRGRLAYAGLRGLRGRVIARAWKALELSWEFY